MRGTTQMRKNPSNLKRKPRGNTAFTPDLDKTGNILRSYTPEIDPFQLRLQRLMQQEKQWERRKIEMISVSTQTEIVDMKDDENSVDKYGPIYLMDDKTVDRLMQELTEVGGISLIYYHKMEYLYRLLLY